MPKVLSVFGLEPFRIGGNETFARELSFQLGKQGWESVLCFLTPPPEEVLRFLQLPNVTLEVLEGSVGVTWRGAKNLARLLHKHQPELVHLHFTSFLGLFPWIARLSLVKKVFITDHGSRPAGHVPVRAPLWKRLMVRLINMPVTKVICVSNYGYKCLTTSDLLPKERFQVIYNCVDLARVVPNPTRASAFKSKYSIPANRTVVLQVSWIIPEKGILELLKAALAVLRQERDVHFVFVGQGRYSDVFQKEALTMGLGENVTFTGLIQDPFNEGVYEAADIVCQVSNWEEVFGWAIAEAMGYSKPVVGTRVGGIPEVIAEGDSGFLADRGDCNAIADRILRLMRDPALRKRMGIRGRLRAEQRFNQPTNVAQLIDLYGLKNRENQHN